MSARSSLRCRIPDGGHAGQPEHDERRERWSCRRGIRRARDRIGRRERQNIVAVGKPNFTVTLNPGAGGKLTLKMKRYGGDATVKFPF
jgi:hypothetical protein